MNWRAVHAIYRFEMARTARTLMQSILAPVISTSLYFVVFGAAIGSRITTMEGVDYGSFIVPGLIMLSPSHDAVATAAPRGAYVPRHKLRRSALGHRVHARSCPAADGSW